MFLRFVNVLVESVIIIIRRLGKMFNIGGIRHIYKSIKYFFRIMGLAFAS